MISGLSWMTIRSTARETSVIGTTSKSEVKNEKYDRFGPNLHSLVSSLSNIVYSISIEKDKCNTIDYVHECLLTSIPKTNYNREPDLSKVVIEFDRDYNGFLNLVFFYSYKRWKHFLYLKTCTS